MSEIKQNESKRSDGFIGSIYFASGILPWEDDFPLVDAYDVAVEGGKRLSDVLKDIATDNGNNGGGSNVELDTTLTLVGKAAEAYATGDAIGKVAKKVDDIDEVITDMASGGTGYVRYIQTFEGDRIVKLFIGTQQEYEYLTSEEKEDLLAIITDVSTSSEGSTSIDGLLNGTIVVKKAECDSAGNKIVDTYSRMDENKVFGATFNDVVGENLWQKIADLPNNKTIEDICVISITMSVTINGTSSDGVEFTHYSSPLEFVVVSKGAKDYDRRIRFATNAMSHNSVTSGVVDFDYPVSMATISGELKEENGGIYILFNQGGYSVFDGNRRLFATTFSKNQFKLLGVNFWLA